MPYSITTQDGITIDNIPDDVPADAPQLRERVAKIRGQGAQTQQAAPAPAGDASRATAPIRLARGGKDGIDAGAQMLSRAPGASFVNNAADAAGDFLNRKIFNTPTFNKIIGAPEGYKGDFAGEVLGVRGQTPQQIDKSIRDAESQYQADRQAGAKKGLSNLVTGEPADPGFDWLRLGGNVASPVNALIPGGGASTTLTRLALRGAAQGAVGGAFQPVTSEDSADNFWGRKAGQVVLGAATGGVVTPAVARAATAVGNGVRNVAQRVQRSARNITPEQINVTAANTARAGGYEWGDIPEAMQQAITRQAEESLRSGQRLDPAAVIRRAEAEAVGLRGDAGLTAGQATGNPMQFTQERNLRGVEIATPQGRGNPLMDRFANQNQVLANNFRDLGAEGATEANTAGQTLIDALRASDAPVRAGVDEAYTAARAMNNGRAAPLERGTFSQTANAALEQGQWGRFLPAEVRGLLNDISSGQTPFDVDAAVQIDGILSSVQRRAGAGSPEASAVGVVRNALRDTPLQAAEFADNGAGQAARDAFDAARQAARNRFANIEATPALAAALDDVAPDQFIQRFILNGNARDLQALRATLESDPAALGQARAQVAAHLQRAAFGENLAGRAQFSPERFAKTLRAIGGQRLGAFFSPEEIQQLNLVARTGATVNTQPAGSAVNNSNTAAGLMSMLGRLAETPLLRRVPGARAVANQIGEMRTERQMNQALSGQLPAPPAELSPETMRALERLFPLTGAAGGALGGMAVQ